MYIFLRACSHETYSLWNCWTYLIMFHGFFDGRKRWNKAKQNKMYVERTSPWNIYIYIWTILAAIYWTKKQKEKHLFIYTHNSLEHTYFGYTYTYMNDFQMPGIANRCEMDGCFWFYFFMTMRYKRERLVY